jgi:hypothetical protein|tara:strand:- start:1778 stop:2086 length:309 start_codon:yes stop_codon:yes gene_type:complete
MKPVTKENLLEAIQKVEDQDKLLRTVYIGSRDCRCVIGHLMTKEELLHIVNTNLQNRKVELLDLDLPDGHIEILSNIQRLNDQSKDLEEFIQKAKDYVESCL